MTARYPLVLNGTTIQELQATDTLAGLSGSAASGANSDITSLSALTTPITIAQGGTNATTAEAALAALGAQATLSAASGSVNGYLTSADWTTFNSKQGALSAADGTTNGYLTSADWSTFNSKQAALGTASASVSGILSSADWSTFNGKQATLVSGTSIKTINGTTLLGSGNITVTVADGALGTPVSGILTNCTGYTYANLSGTVPTWNQNTTGSAVTFTSTTQNSQFNSIGIGTAASGTAGEIRATNNITAYYSDKRLKTNIKVIPDALQKVLSISGITFKPNDIAASFGYVNDAEQVGVIAQEIQAVLPQIVVPAPFDIGKHTDGSEYSISGENYKTVQYEKIVPLLIEAIKELSNEINKLKGGL